MEIKTFWKIIIKGIGLWLLINALYIIPQLTSSLSFIDNELNWNHLFVVLAINLVIFFIYILLVRLFLFKSEWLVNKLKLENDFTEKRIDVGIASETILRIIIVITGALIFVNGLPNLISHIFQFIRQKELIKNYPETSWLLYHFLHTLFGYLIMTNSKLIGKFIDKRSKE